MKMVLGFFSGIITMAILFLCVQLFTPLHAQDEGTSSLTSLLPDIEKIYKEALISPLIKARQNIWDEDIAAYYQYLLERCSLTEEALNPKP